MSQKNHHIIVLFTFLFATPLLAQKTRTQLEADRKRIKKEILQVNKLLFNEEKKGKNALEDLRDIKKKIEVKTALISTISLEIKALETTIESNELEIEKLSNQLKTLKKDYAEMIYSSYKSRSQQNRTMFILSSQSFYQAYKRVKYMNQYATFRKKQGEEVMAQTVIVQRLNDSLHSQRQLKDTLLANEENEQLSVEADKKSMEKLLSQIKTGAKIQTRAKEEKEDEKITSRIDELIREAIAESNRNKATKNSKGFALTPKPKLWLANLNRTRESCLGLLITELSHEVWKATSPHL